MKFMIFLLQDYFFYMVLVVGKVNFLVFKVSEIAWQINKIHIHSVFVCVYVGEHIQENACKSVMVCFIVT